jgi:hypothetical protein
MLLSLLTVAPVLLVTLNVPLESPRAVLLPSTTVSLVPVTVVPPLYELVPLSCTVPPPVKFKVMPLPEISPLTTSVPPLARKKLEVVPLAGARVRGTSIVFVPEVLSARIADALELEVSVALTVCPVSVNTALFALEAVAKVSES